jgi:DNA-binding winged helix-turn-helix (wHTH) protein
VSYTFGEFELDPASYELRRRGSSVELQPKVLELIAYLIEHRDRVVGKTELLSGLWPDVHVGESSLAWCVSQARKALGQKRGDRGPIETVHRRGYRFLLDESAGASTAEASPDQAATRPTARPLFVGRERVLGAMREALGRARSERRGEGHLLLGEAGIGKTRCAEELAGQARAAGLSAWLGRCLEGEGTPAFWPWIQILRESLRDDDAGPTRTIAESLLADLVPRDSATLDPEFMNGRSDGFWVPDRMVRLLVQCADVAPRLLVLDDLQWADPQSMRVLELLVPELDRHAIVLVTTSRDDIAPDPSPARRAFERTLDRLRRHFARHPLTGFGHDEVAAYLAAITGRAPSTQVVADVLGKTGGKPLFVQEMAQRLLERAPDSTVDLGEVEGARSFVLARLERRDPEVLRVLEAASVLGETFELPVLAAMLDASSEALLPSLDAGLEARLIERRAGVGGYAFAHALVRAAVHAGLSDAARCAWHRRAGEALRSRDIDGGHLTQLAFHFHEALPAGTHVDAAHYAVTAAQEAARVFAHEDAHTHWTHALEALDFHPGPEAEARARVLVGFAATELHLGRRAEARTRLKQAIRLAKQHGNATQLVAAARVLRHSLVSHISIDPLARDALETALPSLTDDRERASVLSLLGAVHLGAPSSGRGREASAQALVLARPAGGQTLLEALWSRAFSLTGPDGVDEALALSDEMLQLDASLGRSWWSGEARFVQFGAHSYRGDVAARDRALDQLGRMARYCRLPEAQWHHDRLRSQLSFQAGAFDDAERSWRELSGRGVLARLDYVKILDALNWHMLDAERASSPAAGHEFWKLLSSWIPGPRARSGLLVSLIEAGRRDEARAPFEAMAAAGFGSLPRDRLYLSTLAALATVAMALDDRERARELESLLRPYASFSAPDVVGSTSGSVARYLAQLAGYLGDEGLAHERFELALVRNGELGLRPQLARTELAFAAMLVRSSATRTRAAALVRSAASTARDLGMAGLTAEAVALSSSDAALGIF